MKSQQVSKTPLIVTEAGSPAGAVYVSVKLALLACV